MENSLHWFLKTALSYLGTPYLWGGDDPNGYDCSGFVLECLKTIGVIDEKSDFTVDSLFHHLLEQFTHDTYKPTLISKPTTGALLFYFNKKGKAIHVTICLDNRFQIGAIGGDAGTTNRFQAAQQNAFVKIRPIKDITKVKTVYLFDRE